MSCEPCWWRSSSKPTPVIQRLDIEFTAIRLIARGVQTRRIVIDVIIAAINRIGIKTSEKECAVGSAKIRQPPTCGRELPTVPGREREGMDVADAKVAARLDPGLCGGIAHCALDITAAGRAGA